jgi:hypothetical protein
MRGMMRWLSMTLAVAIVGGFLLTAAPGASAQVRRRVIVVEPYPYYSWGWGWNYPYPYGGYYRVPNYGEVKIETHRKDLSVYIDGGYAANISKDKKFPLRPGNHEVELRNSEGQTVFKEKVAVMVGKTTKLHVS